MKSLICFLMSFLLLTATPALSMADEGGFKNELGVTLSLKDYGIMTDLNLFNFHIKAGISAPAVRDAVVKAAELTGEAAKAVYDTSKHVIVFTGEKAMRMAELATDYGIRASKYAYNKGKKMIVIFGDTAQYIGKKLVKATKQFAKITHGKTNLSENSVIGRTDVYRSFSCMLRRLAIDRPRAVLAISGMS